jgi:predicted acetyltransferase
LPNPANLTISRIGPEADLLLRNLFEHYIHDMSEWFDVDTKADGSYSYDTSTIWRNGSRAYVAKVDDSIAGFALVGSAIEWLGDAGSYDVHEFFVMRRFRGRGHGQRMAALVWNELPGAWLVRVLELNTPAVMFWRRVIAKYSQASYQEEERIVNGDRWRFFRFQSQRVSDTIC